MTNCGIVAVRRSLAQREQRFACGRFVRISLAQKLNAHKIFLRYGMVGKRLHIRFEPGDIILLLTELFRIKTNKLIFQTKAF